MLPEYVVFGLLLVAIALFHQRTFEIAMIGTGLLLLYKIIWTPFHLLDHLRQESHLLINLFALLLGFAILSRHFEESHVPEWLPQRLPDNWTGGLCLLAIVAGISIFFDNIAGAIVGGVIAKRMYGERVRLSFIVAIVAASNAGGAGSVIGDTTTTMMWISGIPATAFLKAFIGAGAAILFSGVVASRRQHAFQPAIKAAAPAPLIDLGRLFIVGMMVVGTIAANIALDFPAVGLWAGILIGGTIRQTAWSELKHAYRGSVFLVLLVLSASVMPVHSLPDPSWQSALALGVVSAVFDNIPLTALAIYQGGYDWGILAFAVGYGGSLIWFGSSAGVAISNIFPEAKSSLNWIIEGWHAAASFVVGFFIMLFFGGWKA